MNNKMTLTANAPKNLNVNDGTTKMASIARRMAAPLAKYYSRVLGTEVSTRQTMLLVNAQAAFFMTVFPVDCHIIMRLACIAWLISALLKCRDCGLKVERL